MTEHEYATSKLREAGSAVEYYDDLPAALREFGFWQNEWQNSIPRDARMKPIRN